MYKLNVVNYPELDVDFKTVGKDKKLKFTLEVEVYPTVELGQYKEIEVETDGINDQHPGVLNAFSDHILYGTALVAEGTEGINGLMISNAAHLSFWTDETVTLPIDEDKFYSLLMEKAASSKAKENVVSKVTEDMSSTF